MNSRIFRPATHQLTALLLSCAVFTVACASESNAVDEQSVAPDINKNFVSPDIDVRLWAKRFEGESREVYRARQAVVAALDLKAGASVADIGAGTGLFVQLFARSVGPQGEVLAVDISPKFIEFIATNAARDGLDNVRTQLGGDRGAELPSASVDVIFHSDTYHHFEFPAAMNADLLRSLKSQGELFVLDFERIPGVTREGLLQHVRAPKEVVIKEIEASGFVLVEEIEVAGLVENYLLRFKKP